MVLIDWFFLAAFGIGMALMSMFMDNIIEYLQKCAIFNISIFRLNFLSFSSIIYYGEERTNRLCLFGLCVHVFVLDSLH